MLTKSMRGHDQQQGGVFSYLSPETRKSRGFPPSAVRSIEGVDNVNKEIKILPNSERDEHIPREVYRAIYGNPVLSLYACAPFRPVVMG